MVISFQFDIPLEHVALVNWPTPTSSVTNYKDSTRLSELNLPDVSNITLDEQYNLAQDLTTSHHDPGVVFHMPESAMDVGTNQLSRTYQMEVKNLDNGETYHMPCDGSQTLGELKNQLANLSKIPTFSQMWDGFPISTEDDNNTMSSILPLCEVLKFTVRSKLALPGGSNLAGTSSSSTAPLHTSQSATRSLPSASKHNLTVGPRTARSTTTNGATSSAVDPVPLNSNNNGASAANNEVVVVADSDDQMSDDDDDDFDDAFDAFHDIAPATSVLYRPGNSMMMPDEVMDEQAALEQFSIEFNSRYGSDGPTFTAQPLADIIRKAFAGSASTRKLLAIYLHNDKSILTNVFCSQMLCKETVSQFLNQHFICWGWDVTSDSNKNQFIDSCRRHFGSAVADTLNGMKTDKYPLLLLVQGKGRSCEVQGIVQGQTDLNEMMADLIRIHEHGERERQQDMRDEVARMERERLIMEQEEAYQKSLEIDQIKAAQEEEEKRRLQAEQQRRLDAQQLKEEEIARLRSLLPPEPTAKSGGQIFQVRFRTPRGENLSRSFLSTDILQSLIDFAGSQGYLASEYHILRSYPKTNLSNLDMKQTLAQCGISKREAVAIEAIENSDDEDDSDDE